SWELSRPAARRLNDIPFAERNTIELAERDPVEAASDRCPRPRDTAIQLVLVPFGIATELAAAVSQHAQELGIVLLEQHQRTVIEQIGRRDRRLAVVDSGKAYLVLGFDEGLLVEA